MGNGVYQKSISHIKTNFFFSLKQLSNYLALAHEKSRSGNYAVHVLCKLYFE